MSILLFLNTALFEMAEQSRRGRLPERYDSGLGTFASQRDDWWRVEPDCSDSGVDDFLHAGTSVVQEAEQRVVTAACGAIAIDRVQDGLDLGDIEVAHNRSRIPL